MDVRTILVPLDFGGPAYHALAYAMDLARSLNATLHLLNVLPNPYVAGPFLATPPEALAGSPVQAMLDDFLRQAKVDLEEAVPASEREKLRVRTFVKVGDPREEIVAHAARNGADLIVMGTHGRTGAAHLFLGSVAERVLRTAPCPVLTVRGPLALAQPGAQAGHAEAVGSAGV